MTVPEYNLTSYELDVLRTSIGLPTSREMYWGAAMGVALEVLSYAGLLTKYGKITDKGRDYLKELGELK